MIVRENKQSWTKKGNTIRNEIKIYRTNKKYVKTVSIYVVLVTFIIL